MQFLIVGLGNIGSEYVGTRHNIGFAVLDKLSLELDAPFCSDRLGYIAKAKYRGKSLCLLKPSTYMNLSGKAYKYWLMAEKIDPKNSLCVVDDIALDVACLRMKSGGSHGGHNGLSSIEESLGTREYPRLRFGIGANFSKGRQADYVLSPFSKSELDIVEPKIDIAVEMIKSFIANGLQNTMNQYNNK